MKRKRQITLSLIIIVIFTLSIGNYLKAHMNSDILLNIEGQIIYKKRVDGVNTLFRSDANTNNEELVYSHKGKGMDSYGRFNDNIIDYHYDLESGTIDFVAMDNGEWSMFSLNEASGVAILLGEAQLIPHSTSMMETDYIKKSTEKINVIAREGSLYIIESGLERRVKKFYGFYDDKFTGYSPIGFSPNGEYLIYHSMEHLTPLGTIIDSMMTQSVGHVYVMDLQTQKSARYIDATKFQWID